MLWNRVPWSLSPTFNITERILNYIWKNQSYYLYINRVRQHFTSSPSPTQITMEIFISNRKFAFGLLPVNYTTRHGYGRLQWIHMFRCFLRLEKSSRVETSSWSSFAKNDSSMHLACAVQSYRFTTQFDHHIKVRTHRAYSAITSWTPIFSRNLDATDSGFLY